MPGRLGTSTAHTRRYRASDILYLHSGDNFVRGRDIFPVEYCAPTRSDAMRYPRNHRGDRFSKNLGREQNTLVSAHIATAWFIAGYVRHAPARERNYAAGGALTHERM